VEEYTHARERAEAALAEQVSVVDKLEAEAASATESAAAAETRATLAEAKASQAEALVADLNAKLEERASVSASEVHHEGHERRRVGGNGAFESSNAPLFDGDLGPPSPLFSPTSMSDEHHFKMEQLGSVSNEKSTPMGEHRSSNQFRSNSNDHKATSDPSESEAMLLRMQNERLTQALNMMRKDVERLSTAPPLLSNDVTTAVSDVSMSQRGTNETLLGAQVLGLQQQVSMLFDQLKKQNDLMSSRRDGTRSEGNDAKQNHQLQSLQHELERAKRKLKRAAAEREKLTELSNQLKSKLERANVERQGKIGQTTEPRSKKS
jgi:hypothetical protein